MERAMLNQSKYIKTIPFSGLFNWSVQYLSETKISFNATYPLAHIGEFLKRNKTGIEIDNDVYYKRATIKVRNGGVFLRDNEIGSKIGTKNQFVINEGQFLLSKIDARNGAFGVVPAELDGGIITGNFWTFDVDYNKVNPYYLSLVVTTPEFILFCEQASNGTTNRHYLQEPLFLDIKIPLPGIDEQNELVNAYNKHMTLAAEQETLAGTIQSEIETYLLKELGIINKPDKQIQGLQFISLKDLSIWGVERLKKQNTNSILNSSIYTNSKLGKAAQVNPTTNIKSLSEDDVMSFIPMECISDLEGEWMEKREGVKSKSSGYTKFQDGDLIWARITPCMQNGKSAIVKGLKNGYGYGSTEFHVIRNLRNEVSLSYIYTLLRLPIVLKNATSFFTGSAGQQRVPKSYLEELVIPLPPVEVQNELVEYINALKSQIKTLRAEAETNRTTALQTFEQKIFK